MPIGWLVIPFAGFIMEYIISYETQNCGIVEIPNYSQINAFSAFEYAAASTAFKNFIWWWFHMRTSLFYKCICMIWLANYSPYKRIIYLAIKNLLQYNKNMKIIKVKRNTRTFVHFFIWNFRKINFKNICSTHYSDSTVLVSSEDTSTSTVRENLEYENQFWMSLSMMGWNFIMLFFLKLIFVH